MLLGALGVGLLAAYYFGLQAGIWAAAAAAALLIAAMVPGLSLYAYVVLAIGVAALAFLGPKLRRPSSPAANLGPLLVVARSYLAKLRSGGKPDDRRRRGSR
jgi:hypothetical protein